MADEENCEFLDLSCGIGNAASEAATTAISEFVRSVGEATVRILGWANSLWLQTPTPDVETFGVSTVQSYLSWYTFAFAVIGVLIALGRMAVTREFRSGSGAIRMMINLIIATGVMAAAFAALMEAGDAFAPWIVEQVTGEALTLDGILTVDILMAGGIGSGLLLGILALLGALANVAFMILRDALVLVLFAFIPTLAASSASEAGAQAFKKALAWLLGFILYKPIAGVIYALGIITLNSPAEIRGMDDVADAIYQTCVAVVILACAALALPAIIKFIAPAAALGSSSAFSGGAVGAAAVATGAAVVSLGATAGASAAAAPAAAGAMSGGAGSAGAMAGGLAGGSALPPTGGGSSGSPTGGSSGGSSGGGAAGAAASTGGSSAAGGSSSASPGSGSGATASPSSGGQAGTSSAGAAAAPATGGNPAGGAAPASGSGVQDASRAVAAVTNTSTVASGAMSETTGEEK
jgi:type IV secretion system protein TrbL